MRREERGIPDVTDNPAGGYRISNFSADDDINLTALSFPHKCDLQLGSFLLGGITSDASHCLRYCHAGGPSEPFDATILQPVFRVISRSGCTASKPGFRVVLVPPFLLSSLISTRPRRRSKQEG